MRLDSNPAVRVFTGSPLSRFALVAGLLLAAHVTALLILGHLPFIGIVSDFLQLAAAIYATAVCFLTSRRSRGITRPFWYLTATTLGLWALGKCLVMYDFYYLGLETIRIVPLLLFFLAAGPMFMAVFLSRDTLREGINWEWLLDAVQVLVLILVIYLFVVYVPLLLHGESAVSELEDRLLAWRNIVLTTGLLLRATLSRLVSVRRLYMPVAIAMGVFTGATWIANRMQEASGGPESAWYDLAWSIPFCMIAIAAAQWREIPEKDRYVPRRRQGLSGAVFAYLFALILPVMLLAKYHEVVREQVVLGLFGLIFSIVLFNARLALIQRRQRLTMEALDASEHQYSLLFERNMAGVYRTTPDGKILNCNPAFADMFGYTREELLGTPAHALYFGGVEERNQEVSRLRRAESPLPREARFRRKDGSPLWVVQNANIEKQPDGSEIVEGTLVDITERKLTSLAIEDWKRRYDAAVLASRQIIYESDPEANRVTMGGCVHEILGYSAEELSGDAAPWLSLIHPEDRAHYHATLRSAVATRATIEFEYRARRKDDSYRTLREQGRAVVDETGRVIRVVGFISDVTEQRVLEAQLRQAQKMEAIGRLAGGVAHDFNNLLTVIDGYCTMQIESTDASDPVHEGATQVKAAADRGAALTQQLLALSRRQVLRPRRVNLNQVISNVEKMLRRLIGEDIEILTTLAPDLGAVNVDPGLVDQVLMNLVVNARDAMPAGGKLTIQTENVELDEDYVHQHEYVHSGRYVLLAVSDNGTGMDPETQAHIFEPFFTTKEPGKGTGLGLPMVYGIVKQSGGYIEVYSELHHGTAVKIYLPRVDGAVEEAAPAVGRDSRMQGTERILLVEDDDLLQRLVVEVLTRRGYEVQVVEKPEEVEALIQQTAECDLLLTDVVMPKISGPELAMRVVRHWPGIKILYMSGYTTNAIVHQGVLEQGFSFLQKPFTPSMLAAKVREVLDAPTRVEPQSF